MQSERLIQVFDGFKVLSGGSSVGTTANRIRFGCFVFAAAAVMFRRATDRGSRTLADVNARSFFS